MSDLLLLTLLSKCLNSLFWTDGWINARWNYHSVLISLSILSVEVLVVLLWSLVSPFPLIIITIICIVIFIASTLIIRTIICKVTWIVSTLIINTIICSVVCTSWNFTLPCQLVQTDTNKNCIKSFKYGLKYQFKLNFIRLVNNIQANSLINFL